MLIYREQVCLILNLKERMHFLLSYIRYEQDSYDYLRKLNFKETPHVCLDGIAKSMEVSSMIIYINICNQNRT